MTEFHSANTPTGDDPAVTHDHDSGCALSCDQQQVTAANGCDAPCPLCDTYYTCIVPGPHDGTHYCSQGHAW